MIAARFDARSELDQAVTELQAAGFAQRDIHVYDLSSPGQLPPAGAAIKGATAEHVTVRAPSANDRERAIEIFSACHAQHVEVERGTRHAAWRRPARGVTPIQVV